MNSKELHKTLAQYIGLRVRISSDATSSNTLWRDSYPELVEVLPTNPRHDIFVSPLVEPHMQDIGSTSKHLSRINIAVRIIRAPEKPIVLALRV